MRWLLPLLLVSFAGCVETGGGQDAADGLSFSLYEYDGWAQGTPVGFAWRVMNDADVPRTYRMQLDGAATKSMGLVDADGWARQHLWTGDFIYSPEAVIAPGSTHLWLAEAVPLAGNLTLRLVPRDGIGNETHRTWDVEPSGGLPIRPGDHVQTATVGLWVNGTSFYTNIQSLNDDPAFPAGYDRAEFDGGPLPIYVYDADRMEQPIGSRDTCHFTTIDGYNALLKTQDARSTGVRYLQPEEAYTSPGREEFFLYGEPLIFINTILAYDGSTGPADLLPAPTGACFDAQNTVNYVSERSPLEPPF